MAGSQLETRAMAMICGPSVVEPCEHGTGPHHSSRVRGAQWFQIETGGTGQLFCDHFADAWHVLSRFSLPEDKTNSKIRASGDSSASVHL